LALVGFNFSENNCSWETYLVVLKTGGGVGSGQFSKALGEAARNLSSNRSKGFQLADFKMN
jgi:hypothetical protein